MKKQKKKLNKILKNIQLTNKKGKWKFLPQRKNKNAELYNLENDPSELHNLIFAYPQLAQKLKIEIEQVYNKNN